ncbi:MAG: CoA transferase [Acidimicrobiia bacterium]
MSDAHPAPLQGVRVVDITDEFGGYAGRLLAGLGADVIRVHDQRRVRVPPLPPLIEVGDDVTSLFDEFVHGGKRSIALDTALATGIEMLERLVQSADVVLSAADGRAPGGWSEVNPGVVHVVITPFGWDRSPEWSPVDDLIVLGAGGLLHLGGYPDTGPVGPFGGQSQIAAGIFAAVAVMVGLIEKEATGEGSSADVSAQEAIAQALEDSLPTFVLTGEIREPQGEEAREAGTGVYACRDGYVSMVAGRLGTARAWAALVDWMNEGETAAGELREPQWAEFSFRQTTEASDRFRQIFETFASTRRKEQLYIDAQQRGIALSPVSDTSDLLQNEQLEAREFFTHFRHPGLGLDLIAPRTPFRMSLTSPVDLGAAPVPGGDTAKILADLGLTDEELASLVEGGVV